MDHAPTSRKGRDRHAWFARQGACLERARVPLSSSAARHRKRQERLEKTKAIRVICSVQSGIRINYLKKPGILLTDGPSRSKLPSARTPPKASFHGKTTGCPGRARRG